MKRKYPRVTITVRPGVLKRAKREVIRAAMLASKGVISDAAKLLGIHRQTLQRLLKKKS